MLTRTLVAALCAFCAFGVATTEEPSEMTAQRRQQGTDHFCCTDKNIEKGRMQNMTKITYTYVLATHMEVTGYVKCGALGLSRCAVETIRYSQDLHSHVETFLTTVYDPCPKEKIVCCPGYFSTPDGHCVSYEFGIDQQLAENLQKLKDMGIVIGK